MSCLHCKRDKTIFRRGLCQGCCRLPSVRRRYPELPRPSRETDADLDAMIAEQMKCLPKGWEQSSRQAREPR